MMDSEFPTPFSWYLTSRTVYAIIRFYSSVKRHVISKRPLGGVLGLRSWPILKGRPRLSVSGLLQFFVYLQRNWNYERFLLCWKFPTVAECRRFLKFSTSFGLRSSAGPERALPAPETPLLRHHWPLCDSPFGLCVSLLYQTNNTTKRHKKRYISGKYGAPNATDF